MGRAIAALLAVWGVGAVCCLGPGAASSAHAAPVLTVRARSTITLDPIVRTYEGVVVSGQVVERSTTNKVAFVLVRVRLDDQQVEMMTDDEGKFRTPFVVADGKHNLAVDFVGDVHYSAASFTIADFDVRKDPLSLSIQTDSTIADTEPDVVFVVKASVNRTPVSVAVEVFGGPAEGNDLQRLGVAITDSLGRGDLQIHRLELGGPGKKRVEARFPGDDTYDPATASTTFAITAQTIVELEIEDHAVAYEDSIEASGVVTDNLGSGISGLAVSLRIDDKTVADGITDDDGSFDLRVDAANFQPGKVSVQVVFRSNQSWLSSSRSDPVSVVISERRPVPVGYTLAAFGATAMALILFVGLRTKPWQHWKWLELLRKSETDDAPVEPAADHKAKLHRGLAPARPSLVSTLRRPHDFGFSGAIRNTVNGSAVQSATVELTLPATDDKRLHEAMADGRFEIEDLTAGEWQCLAVAPGFCSENFRLTIPHRGELRNSRIDLLPVRERIFELYREVAAPLLPNQDLWGIWTPRQIFDHVRKQRPAEALESLTDYVEESYFSQRTPHEDDLERAARMVAEAMDESAEISV